MSDRFSPSAWTLGGHFLWVTRLEHEPPVDNCAKNFRVRDFVFAYLEKIAIENDKIGALARFGSGRTRLLPAPS